MHEEDVTRLYNYTDKEIVRRLIRYSKPFRKHFAIVYSIMFVTILFALYEPIVIGNTISLFSESSFELSQLLNNITILVVIILSTRILTYAQNIILNITGQGIIFNVRKDVFTHLEYHDLAYLHQKAAGALVTRVTNDTNALNEFYTSVLITIFQSSFKVIGIIIVMFYINAQLTLYVLTVVPLIIIASYFFRTLSRKAYRQIRSNLSSVNAFLAEHLSGMKIIQIFNKEHIKYIQFKERNDKLKASYYRQIGIFAVFRPTMYMVHMLAVVIVLYFGSQSILSGAYQVGLLIMFHRYVSDLFNPIQQLAEQFNIVQSAFAAGERIFGILDTKPQVVDQDSAMDIDHVQGSIEFKNVWFAYNEGEWVLQDVSFKVNAKESAAFVGATGAGKTTILSLITRYYDIQRGQILIDGVDIKTIKKRSLRKYIGQMLQDVFLFSGTIRSNITLRNDTITQETLEQACNYVNASYFINKLPQKYDEEVRERGNNFSSGQRQLLSFARTIVHDPKVMILDEATSNIDTETEQLIQDSLEKMMSIGTMLVVAHRLSTIQNVDKIIVLSHGKVIEEGSHQELLRHRGHYYNLYKLQYQEESDTT
ncbi:ABC transporter ATP-binding protein [Candidatus Xianfuyuplasma coldseepsis]|uniref:ABC transporter ATP-binding protein n=2 Tax=Candidatus Xianfuyuplasma coldseepsis TaxID=2782163 RepID=A0A7L7KTA9_9MOLU|nr:ABC transporter ATP-binding protein [Xianfuyuplasma coldseepsis]